MSAHPIPAAALAQHTIVLGKTRSGKSSAMRLMVESALDDQRPVCIIDPKGDWWGLKSSASGKHAGYPVIIFGGEHADVPLNRHAGAQVAELVATGNRPCIIDLGGWSVGDRTRFFIDFASTLFRLSRGPRLLVIDEVHNFAPQGKVMDPDAGKMLHWANRLASEGSGKGITLLSASQRPQKVHKDFVTSNETLIAMRVIHPLDRGAIKDWIDGCPDPEKGKEVLGSLASMTRGEGWAWSPEISFGPKRIKFPKFSTYDSFAAPTDDAGAKLTGWAAVDLEEVKTKLAAVVEEAKANDPKALKAEIAELRKKLASAPAAQTAPDPQAIAAAEQRGEARGYERGFYEGREFVARTAKENLTGWFRGVQEGMSATIAGIDDLGRPSPLSAIRPSTRPIPQPPRPAPQKANGSHAPVPRPVAAPKGDGTLNGAQRRVVNSLAFWNSAGDDAPTREQVAGVAGYSPGSGNFNNVLSSLRTMGAIEYPSGGRLRLVDPSLADGAMSRSEARDVLHGVFGGPQKKIVGILIESREDELTREEIAQRSDYSAGSGNFNNLLSSLRTLSVIDYPSKGYVALAPWARTVLAP